VRRKFKRGATKGRKIKTESKNERKKERKRGCSIIKREKERERGDQIEKNEGMKERDKFKECPNAALILLQIVVSLDLKFSHN